MYDKIRGIKTVCTALQQKAISYVYLGTDTSIVVCISPLTAIMIEQQQKFLEKGIKAQFVGEAQVDDAVIKRVLQGNRLRWKTILCNVELQLLCAINHTTEILQRRLLVLQIWARSTIPRRFYNEDYWFSKYGHGQPCHVKLLILQIWARSTMPRRIYNEDY